MNYPDRLDQLFQEAYAAAERGDELAARGVLQQLLALDPNHIEALVLLGYISPTLEARDYFERALQLNPYHDQAQRGLLELEANQQQRAMGALFLVIPSIIAVMGLIGLLGFLLLNNNEGETEPTVTIIGIIDTSTASPTSTQSVTMAASPTPSETIALPTVYLSPTPLIRLFNTPRQFVPTTPTVAPSLTAVAQDFTATATTAPSQTATASATNTEDPNMTWTPTPTLTSTLTPAPSATNTEDPNETWTPTSTSSSTPSATNTATATATNTEDPNETWTPTPTLTDTATLVPTATVTNVSVPSNTPTVTHTPTVTLTPSATYTPDGSPTVTPEFSPTSTNTPTATNTLSVTATPTVTLTPSVTTAPSATATETATNTPTPSATNTPDPVITPTATFTETPTNTPTATFTETATFTLTPTATFTSSPTDTATSTPTATETPTLTATFTATTTLTPTLSPTPSVTTFNDSATMLSLINAERCANGLPPVTVSGALNSSATTHSIDMALNDFVGQTGSDSSSPTARMAAAGYGPIVLAGENVRGGPATASDAFSQWMASESGNIMNPDLREIGVGHAYRDGTTFLHYWTLDMASTGSAPGACP